MHGVYDLIFPPPCASLLWEYAECYYGLKLTVTLFLLVAKRNTPMSHDEVWVLLIGKFEHRAELMFQRQFKFPFESVCNEIAVTCLLH